METRIRHLLAGTVLLLYGSAVIVGEGWHALLPVGACNCWTAASCCSDCPDHCQRDAHLEALLDEAQHGETQVRVGTHGSTGDCPVCALLAQVQCRGDVLESPHLWDAVDVVRPLAASLVVPQPVHKPYSARGPPSVSV